MRKVTLDEIAVILVKHCFEKDHDKYRKFREIVHGVRAGGPAVIYGIEQGVIRFERHPGNETLFKGTINLPEVVIEDGQMRLEYEMPASILTRHKESISEGKLRLGDVVDFESLKDREVQGVQQYNFAGQNITRYNLVSGNSVAWESVEDQLEGKTVSDFLGEITQDWGKR